jgi:regulator of protease activity HflC (stomatin/prohibitin superfamily)
MATLKELLKPKAGIEAKQANPVSGTLFLVVLAAGLAASWATDQWRRDAVPWWFLGSFLPAVYILFALKIAQQWEKAIVLRFGRFHRLAGPGMFWMIPIVDSIPAWIDHRVMVTSFSAEKTLTKDTVPINVDAVLFWLVWDAQKAALEVENYREAITWAAQTALRDIIGSMILADILVGRQKIDAELQQIIDQRTTPWGITVQSVEIRDIVIPEALEDAMSRQAQAERERQARIILGTAETEVALKFAQAAKAYENNPTALQLRAMNILYEGLKAKGALVVVPSTAVETMGLGAVTGLTSLSHITGVAQAEKAEGKG